ncbi:hypothetical protein [Paraoerskovia marina]|uniref:Uncharacterized protein n=1 Tax=Paraoerskovia marina TaxID=545619 RepID=A0A1H1Q7L3_9CELL|nr:hypothetical protein [Paraoerskovia marina]SDS18919.1 hypothetical protein SAMN04489860_0998 [Paraoerskovia marina]
MYGWIYRHLPGPAALRVFIMLAAAAGVVVLLFGWVFPWVSAEIDYFNPELG